MTAEQSLETDPGPPELSQLGVSTGWQLPHVSCEASKGDFPKSESSHSHPAPPHVPKLKSFHGDRQIADPSKTELEGKKIIKLSIPREPGLASSKLPSSTAEDEGPA